MRYCFLIVAVKGAKWELGMRYISLICCTSMSYFCSKWQSTFQLLLKLPTQYLLGRKYLIIRVHVPLRMFTIKRAFKLPYFVHVFQEALLSVAGAAMLIGVGVATLDSYDHPELGSPAGKTLAGLCMSGGGLFIVNLLFVLKAIREHQNYFLSVEKAKRRKKETVMIQKHLLIFLPHPTFTHQQQSIQPPQQHNNKKKGKKGGRGMVVW